MLVSSQLCSQLCWVNSSNWLWWSISTMEAINSTHQDFFPESLLLNTDQHTTAQTSSSESGAYSKLLGLTLGLSRNSLITPANNSHCHHPRVPVHLWTSEPVKLLSCFRLFAIPWIIAYQAPPSMEFSRQEYWSGLPFPSSISESSRIPLISRFQRGIFHFCPKYWRRKWQPALIILAWEIPWTEEPGGLQFIRLQSWTWLSD